MIRGSVLGLRPPGHDVHILCLEGDHLTHLSHYLQEVLNSFISLSIQSFIYSLIPCTETCQKPEENANNEKHFLYDNTDGDIGELIIICAYCHDYNDQL